MPVARLCCIDPRVPKDEVFCWSSAGASLPDDLLENLAMWVYRFDRLEIVTHVDCAHSRRELGLSLDELTDEEWQRMEDQSAKRRGRVVRKLLADERVQKAIESGLELAVGHYDVFEERIDWLDEELDALTSES